MASVVRQQRQELIEFLEGSGLFDDLPLIPEDSGDYENEYTRSLGPVLVGSGGKQGVMAIVHSVFAPPDKEDDHGRVFKFIHGLTVVENVAINRAAGGTLVSRDEWAEKLARNVTGIFKPTVASSPLIVDGELGDGIYAHKAEGEDRFSEFPAKFISFACAGTLGAPEMPLIEKPVIDVTDPGNIIITSATPGAAIFYTIDGTKPRPGKTLYTAPFAASGVTIKARAYLIGYLQPGNTDRDSIAEANV
jgi:hypothetical protein